MISPFEVYLVMQLDKIEAGSVLVCLLLVGLCLFLWLTIAGRADHLKETDEYAKWVQLAKLFSVGLVGMVIFTTLLPSTKTAAAMLILPAITSDEVVEPLGNEARELYDLAKQALRKSLDAPLDTTTSAVEKDK